MVGRRSLVVLAAALLAVTLVSGTGGFSSAAAERSVDVAVAEDDEAFVGVETGDIGRCGGNQVALTVTNRFHTDLHTVEARVVDDSSDIRAEVMETPHHLGSGEDGDVVVRVTPATPADEDAGNGDAVDGTIHVHLTVEGDGTTVELTRPVPVECPSPANGEKGADGTASGSD